MLLLPEFREIDPVGYGADPGPHAFFVRSELQHPACLGAQIKLMPLRIVKMILVDWKLFPVAAERNPLVQLFQRVDTCHRRCAPTAEGGFKGVFYGSERPGGNRPVPLIGKYFRKNVRVGQFHGDERRQQRQLLVSGRTRETVIYHHDTCGEP